MGGWPPTKLPLIPGSPFIEHTCYPLRVFAPLQPAAWDPSRFTSGRRSSPARRPSLSVSGCSYHPAERPLRGPRSAEFVHLAGTTGRPRSAARDGSFFPDRGFARLAAMARSASTCLPRIPCARRFAGGVVAPASRGVRGSRALVGPGGSSRPPLATSPSAGATTRLRRASPAPDHCVEPAGRGAVRQQGPDALVKRDVGEVRGGSRGPPLNKTDETGDTPNLETGAMLSGHVNVGCGIGPQVERGAVVTVS
jgi:hypothetical protein